MQERDSGFELLAGVFAHLVSKRHNGAVGFLVRLVGTPVLGLGLACGATETRSVQEHAVTGNETSSSGGTGGTEPGSDAASNTTQGSTGAPTGTAGAPTTSDGSTATDATSGGSGVGGTAMLTSGTITNGVATANSTATTTGTATTGAQCVCLMTLKATLALPNALPSLRGEVVEICVDGAACASGRFRYFEFEDVLGYVDSFGTPAPEGYQEGYVVVLHNDVERIEITHEQVFGEQLTVNFYSGDQLTSSVEGELQPTPTCGSCVRAEFSNL